MTRWVRVAPEAAAIWVRPFLERHCAGVFSLTDQAIANAWCTADPERAISLVVERPEVGAGAGIAWQAISAIMKRDPTAGLERALALPEGNLRMSAVNSAINEWAKFDPTAALACLDSLNLPDRWQVAALARLLPELATKDPGAALAEIARRMGPSATGRVAPLYRYALQSAAGADPTTALALTEGMPETMQNGFALTVLRGWAERDPIKALKWGQMHGMELDQAALFSDGGRSQSSVLAQALTTDPEKTVAWLRTLPADDERARLLTSALNFMTAETAHAVFAELPIEHQIQIAGDLSRQAVKLGTDEAIAWSKSVEVGPARSRVISEVVGNAVDASVERLNGVIAQYSPGTDRDAALRGAVSAMAREPESAMTFASQITNPDVREEAFRKLAAKWLYRNGPAAKAWLAETQELSADVKAMVTRMAAETERR